MEDNNRTEKILYFVVGFLILIALILVFWSPSNNVTPAKTSEVQNVVLERRELSLLVGESHNLTYVVSPSNANNKNVTFVSNNESVATVDANGKIYAVSPGTTIIRVTATNGIYSECNVNVTTKEVPIDTISLDKEDITLNIGESFQFKATIEPSNATDHNLTWLSSDPDVVSVNNGKITGIKQGTALITVKSKNGKIAICDVTVGVDVKTVTIREKIVKMAVGGSRKLEATISPSDASNKTITWSSSDSSIIEISNNGTLKAKKAGSATITAKAYNGVKDTATVTVRTLGPTVASAISSLNTGSFDMNGTTIAFGSDYQGSNRKSNFTAILNSLKNNGINPSLISILGDYQNSGSGESGSKNGIKEAYSVIKGVFPNTSALFMQGNHDASHYTYLTQSGGYEANNYAIFVINRNDFQNSSSQSISTVSAIANKLDTFLSMLSDADKPVFVITHVPLHYSSRGDNRRAYLLVDVLNKYGGKMNIIFMFGHNHSSKYDDCLGGSINYVKKGGSFKHYAASGTTTTTIKFTYMNAGYIGIANNTNGQVSCSGSKVNSTNVLTMSVFKIDGNKATMTRYSSSGKVFTDIIK